MSLVLHGHHVLLIATLAFVSAVLTPNWHPNSVGDVKLNVFQICKSNVSSQPCAWILSSPIKQPFANETKIVYLILGASSAIACVGLSLIGLLLGSWYIHLYARDEGSTWLRILLILLTLFSFLFSCGVWTIMLTTNLHQNNSQTLDIRLKDLGFSFWINIGSSGLYLYAFFIYLIVICKS